MKQNLNISKLIPCLILLIMLASCSPEKNQDTRLAEMVKEDFRQSWNAYKKFAWGHDVLKPLSQSHADWYAEPLYISPIDAYSTMKVMGLDKEAAEVHRYLLDSVRFDKDLFVKTFEVNIRILGGLLAMYQYSTDTAVLNLAADFGTRMLAAFNSPTGLPYYWFNLKTGEAKGAEINVAEAGSYLFEMSILSRLTGNPVFGEKALAASKAVFDRRSEIGLIGERINVETGQWTDTRSHIGCCIDSYYEYLLKSWILFGDKKAKKMWDQSLKAINRYFVDTVDGRLWYAQADMHSGEIQNRIVTLYDAFFPAALALAGDLTHAEAYQHSWNWLWNKNELEPMVYDYGMDSITNPRYDLNPEIIESAYYLYRITGKPEYRQMAENYYHDLRRYCRTDSVYTAIANVITKEQRDYVPTFFFAETLKYLYLSFAPEGREFLDSHVFSTEAHPFSISFVKNGVHQ
ncbi:MAG: glycoside hydrolase family 47 protein [Bacteroidales bacterium]